MIAEISNRQLEIIEAAGKILTESGINGLTTIVSHESGEWLKATYVMSPVPEVIDKETKERAIKPQSLGSVITYQRRYALCAALAICADDDNDGHAKLPKETDKPKKSVAELLKQS